MTIVLTRNGVRRRLRVQPRARRRARAWTSGRAQGTREAADLVEALGYPELAQTLRAVMAARPQGERFAD
ncbi:MAG: hypothetical protein K6V97_04125 [Actinomycetia bacterium]|nr:hypothetical protein [Actinomycetes bacterium]